jgi:1-acyl-sn-glycerol-3-phosphate acyltransferase
MPKKINIIIEGMEHIPTDRPVCFAMNHTDRYNCWPFQTRLLHERNEFTVSWVKAKYYKNFLTRFFLTASSNIPLASRGYIIANLFLQSVGRSPTNNEYRFIRDLLDQRQELDQEALLSASSECRQFLSPSPAKRLQDIETHFTELSKEVLELNRQALSLGHHLMVFPQGTRSKRLLTGHTGMAQMTQALGIDIIPIACMGSENCYPSSNPWAKPGTIRYRIGEVLSVDGEKLAPYRCSPDFIPFARSAQLEFGTQFRKITDIVMNEINQLLDEPYQLLENSSTNPVAPSHFL